jgi:hypothetical protein
LPPEIKFTRPAGTIRFAAQAGIMLVSAGNTVEALEMRSGKSLRLITELPNLSAGLEVSPNGRVFSLPATEGGVLLYDLMAGDVLATYPDHRRLDWIDSRTAVLSRTNYTRSDLLDFDTGEVTPIVGFQGGYDRMLTLPSQPGHFLLANSAGSLAHYAWTRTPELRGIALVGGTQVPPMGIDWGTLRGDLTVDGRHLAQAGSDQFLVVNTATFQVQVHSLPDQLVLAAMPLPDPDLVLLSLVVPRARQPEMRAIYSIGRRSYAPVEDRVMLLGGPLTGRTLRVGSMGTVVQSMGSAIRPFPLPTDSVFYGETAFQQYLQSLADVPTNSGRGIQAASPGGATPVNGPIQDLSVGARVEAVGVYEPAGRTVSTGNARSPAAVQIIVRPADKPIVLVLCSYEPVEWMLQLMPGARLKAVLLSGYKQSTVVGAGDVRVQDLGQVYAYQAGGPEYSRLQAEVRRWTGNSIEVFQGRYSGKVFLVGGR